MAELCIQSVLPCHQQGFKRYIHFGGLRTKQQGYLAAGFRLLVQRVRSCSVRASDLDVSRG